MWLVDSPSEPLAYLHMSGLILEILDHQLLSLYRLSVGWLSELTDHLRMSCQILGDTRPYTSVFV